MASRLTPRRGRKPTKAQKRHSSPVADAPSPWSGRCLLILLSVCLVVAGGMIRVQFLGRSLWLDEAWVANSIRAASLTEALYYDRWLQTTPPLFVILSRVIDGFFGTSNLTLRLLPAFFGIASIPLFFVMAFRLLKPSFAIMASVLFVFNPQLILYSQSLKQYSSDVFSTIALLVLGSLYLEKRNDLRFYSLLSGCIAGSFLAYPAMLFWPFVVSVSFLRAGLLERATEMNAARLLQPIFIVTLGTLVVMANYSWFIMPNSNTALADFFAEGFYHGGGFVEFMRFYAARFSSLADSFFFGQVGVLRIGTLFVILGGLVYLWAAHFRMARFEGLAKPLLLTAPLAAVVALNVVGVFPLPGFHHRLLLFFSPLTILIFCVGLQFLTGITALSVAWRMKVFTASSIETVLGLIAVVALSVPVLVFFSAIGPAPIFAEDHEDIEPAIEYLSPRIHSNDVLYVHATMSEPFELYRHRLTSPTSGIIYGKIGSPCCPRHEYRDPRQESADDISSEISVVSKAAAGRSLWLLSTDRALHWLHVGRNDVAIFNRALPGRGCRKGDEAKFAGIYIGRFDCASR